MNDDKPQTVTFEEAVKLLPAGDHIHTFRQSGLMVIGADHSRASLLEAMKAAPEIQVTGQAAQGMKHGLAIHDETGWLFIEATNAGQSNAAKESK